MLQGFPLDQKSIMILDNMYRIVLPEECQYMEEWLEPNPKAGEEGQNSHIKTEKAGYITRNYVIDGKARILKTFRTPYLDKEGALKGIAMLNEWARRRGGRPKNS